MWAWKAHRVWANAAQPHRPVRLEPPAAGTHSTRVPRSTAERSADSNRSAAEEPMSHLDRLDPGATRRRSITVAVRAVLAVALVAFLALSLLTTG